MHPVGERRLANEWHLMRDLAGRNPDRIMDLRMRGSVITLRLRGPDALPVGTDGHHCPVSQHALRMEFPVHFPAVPLEMYLEVPVVHPNIHPETGFVCLWDRHRVSHTTEHAMHRLVAMLAGELRNLDAVHVMQPDAVVHPQRSAAMPLLGVEHMDALLGPVPAVRRRRLQ